jgi:MoaA/NifB/PqqE/SkfB family radical SAM enzyme
MINDLKRLDILVISYDSPEEVHDEYRKKGSYKKVIEAIKIARKNRIKVWTTTVLTKNNIDCMDFVLEKAKELDFRVSFQPVYNYPLSTDVNSILPSLKDFRETIKQLIRRKKSGAPLIYSLSFLNYLYKTWPTYDQSILKCLAGKFFCVVSPSGNVHPCQPLQKNIKPLNGLKVGFKKAFENIGDFACEGCFCDSFIESNFLFSFDLHAIYNSFKIF